VSVKGNELELTATDLEMGLKEKLVCQTEEEGKTTLPAKKFLEITRQLQDSDLILTTDHRWRAKITSGTNTSFSLSGMDPADFPAWPVLADIDTTVVEKIQLMSLIDRSLYAASTEESRFNLNTILFECEESQTIAVATNGHKLGYASENIVMPDKGRFLIDRKTLQTAKRIIDSTKDENLELGRNAKNLVIKTPNLIATLRLLDGDYPDYAKAIPSNPLATIKINRHELIKAIRRVSSLTNNLTNRININVINNNLKCSVINPDLGEGEDNIDVDYFSADAINVCVNPQYILQVLSVLDTDVITVDYFKEGSPLIFRPIDGRYYGLVMPMRIS
jgi:DNA polymerase-3 subunit beta